MFSGVSEIRNRRGGKRCTGVWWMVGLSFSFGGQCPTSHHTPPSPSPAFLHLRDCMVKCLVQAVQLIEGT